MYTRRIAVRGLIFDNKKLFAQKLKNNHGVENNFWSTPGGGLNAGEDILAGLHREMIEETGIPPKIGKLLLVQQFHAGNMEHLEFFFHIENTADYKRIDLSATTHGLLEVSRFGFIDPTTEHILPICVKTLHPLIDRVQIFNALVQDQPN